MAELMDIRLLLTGRDLLRPPPDQPAIGLLAMGDIDYGSTTSQKVAAAPATPSPVVGEARLERTRSLTQEALRAGFGPLPKSREEVEAIAGQYRVARRTEPVEVWTGTDASEARLRAREHPPRVLHLATHGFYRPH